MTPVEALIDKAPIGALQLRVAALCAIVAMLDGFDTQVIAFVAPVLAESWAITPERFGLIFSAGLLGIMVGQLMLGPISDRFGRRPVIIGCTALFGICTLCTAAVESWLPLLFLRFVTGLGLGGATPNLIALTSELSPLRARATMITTMFAGFPLGAAAGGFVSAHLIPAYGWEAIFIVGGLVPLGLIVFLVPWLSESPHFLAGRPGKEARLAALLRRISPLHQSVVQPLRTTEKPAPAGLTTSYRRLFSDGLGKYTVPLWIAFFNSLLMIYFLMSWIPTLSKESGLQLDAAIISSVFLNLGGALGGIILGRLSDRLGPFRVLTISYGLAGTSLALIGLTGMDATFLLALVFAAGLFTLGGQTAMNAATTTLYPASSRATALGAALAVGRIGSIAGPMIGGLLLTSEWPLSTIFIVISLPAFLTTVVAASLAGLTRGAIRAIG